MSLFRVDSDLKCTYEGSLENSVLREGNFYIHKVFDRKSSTGATDYNAFEVFDHALKPVPLTYGTAKLVGISVEYWWSLGSFSKDLEEVFVPRGKEFGVKSAPEYKKGPRMCMYKNYLNWVINREQFSHKYCVIAVQDSEGTIAAIPSFFSDSIEIQQSLLYLSLVNDFKTHVTAKLFWILMQLEGIVANNAADSSRLKSYVEDVVKPLYNNSLNSNKEFHEVDSEIFTMYNLLVKRAYA